MSSFLSNTPSPPGLEAPQQQPVDPKQPGPAETTQSPVSSPQADDQFAWIAHWGRTHGSSASHQFHTQARWEQDKLKHQRIYMGRRRQTQPWDDSFDMRGNAYNNVRNSWIEQGIWRKVWDEPWAKERDVGLSDQSPHSLKPEPTKSQPGYRWGHEDGGPPPDKEFERDPYRTIRAPRARLGGMSLDEKWYVEGSIPGPNFPVPKPRARNSEASRPYRQFLYQIAKEREWIKDEMDFRRAFRPYNLDLDSMAYKTVKHNWKWERIWKPEWDKLPGSTWAHEDPIQEQDRERPVGTVEKSSEQPSTVIHRPYKQVSEIVDDCAKIPLSQRCDPFTQELLYPEVIPGSADDVCEAIPGGAISGQEALDFTYQTAIADGTNNLGQASKDQNGTTNSPQGETCGSEDGDLFGPTLRPQVQIQPPGSHGESSKSGGKQKRARRQSDELDEQPPKRPKHTHQHSSREVSGPAGTDNEALTPRDVITKGKQVAEGEALGAVSNPRRPSPGITEGGGQRASRVAAEQQGGEWSFGPSRLGKRRRPRQADQNDTPRNAKRQNKSGKHGRERSLPRSPQSSNTTLQTFYDFNDGYA
ncbi:hypothetical protein NCS52_00186100 [Fusarium sp. LHS14.1]|nr:hypothetical protein NCS52_00186100 [Fusarium sp. LHS14.1]